MSDPKDQFEEEETEAMGEPTTEEYMTFTQLNYDWEINKKGRIELKGQFLTELSDYALCGINGKDAVEHINFFRDSRFEKRAQRLPNDIYSLVDSNETAKDLWDALERQMHGFEYGEQDRKAAILYEYETFKANEGGQLLDTYLCYLQVINDLKKCGDVNDALGYKKKAVVVTSDPLSLVAEKTKRENCKKAKVKDYNYYKTKMLLAKKDSDEQDTLYNGRKGIGFENPSYFEKEKDLRPSLYDEKVIGLGYTLMFLIHLDEALEIEKFKRARENKIEFVYDYGNLNGSYVNEKINLSDDYFQEIINPDFEKIDSPFQQTSSLKLYVPTVILEKIIIDLEDEVVGILEKEKENLKTNESLKSKDTFSSVRRPKHNGFIWKKKGSSNTSNVDLSSVSLSKLNKTVKRYSRKDLLSCNNSHLGETSSAYVCHDAMNVSCNSNMCDLFDENNLFIFDDESVRISPVSKMPFKKKPYDSMNIVQICLWIIDSGCSKHMTGNRALLTNFVEKFLETVHFGNNDFLMIAGYGDVVIGSMTNYVEGLGHNLFSVGQFCDKGLKVAFRKSTCFVRNEDGLPKMKFEKDHLCSTFEQGKIYRKHHKSKMTFASNKPFYLFHMDLCGPMHVENEASEVIISFIKKTQVNLQLQVQCVRIDNGTKFKNKTLAKFFDEDGITKQFSAARTPQQNGVVERRNRTLVEAARTMLTFANLPLCYLLNDYEDVRKLKAKGEIGVFVGYSKEFAVFKIYNKQTRRIYESVNVNFNEISEMASKQFSLEHGLSNSNETGKSSNQSISQVSKVSKKDLEDLFQNFYDEYFDSSKIMKSSTTNVETSNVEVPSNQEEVFMRWKFLIHTILQSMSAKHTSWNEFSWAMASAVICLSTGGWEKDAQGLKHHYLREALDACAALARQVEHLEHDKVAQDLEIIKLKTRVKKLKRTNKGRIIDELDKDEGAVLMNERRKHKRLGITLKAVETMQEDESEVQEAVEVVTTAKLITEVIAAVSETVSAAAIVPAAVSEKVSVAAVVPTVTAAPIKVVVPSTRRRRVIIKDPEEESSAKTPTETKSKDKGKVKMVKEPKPIKKKQHVELDEALDYFKGMSYDDIRPIFESKFNANMEFLLKSKEQIEEEANRAIESINETPAQKAAKRRKMNKEVKDVEEIKQHLEIVPNEDDDVYTEATLLVRMVPVVDYQIVHFNNKPNFKIIHADGTHQLYVSLITLLKNFDREDLESLWSLVKERFSTLKPNNFSDDYLLTTLRAMFGRPDGQDLIWKSQRSMILLVERRYPLLKFTLDQMLNTVRLQVEEQSEMSLELIRFTRQQLQEGQHN
uniref:Integrase catalytic domain-containing protein n=1 Tax=Tanacetum cinerariifolium TaxID=118510 RepID=A0A6L2NS56_TANCI|nr:hypothetical protein [Tanacetum cinerariifolium]